jgi:WD40 repeat protein
MRKRHYLVLAAGLLIVSLTHLVAADVVTQPTRSYGLGDLQVLAVSPNGTHLATAGQTGAFLWDLETGQVRHRFEQHGTRVTAAAFSPDSHTLLTGARDGAIRVWTVETGALLHVDIAHSREINSVAWAPDGQSYASASSDNTTRVGSFPSGLPVRTFTVPGSSMNNAVFTTDGTRLVTADGSLTNNVALWDLAAGDRLRSFGEHVGSVRWLVLLDDERLATAGDDLKVRLWNLNTGERLRTLDGATLILNGLAVGPNPGSLIAGCLDGRILAWDTDSGAVIHNQLTDPIAALAQVILTSQLVLATTQNQVRFWNLDTGSISRALDGHTTSTTTGVAFAPDGRFVLSGGNEQTTRLWNRHTGEIVRTFEGHAAGTATVAFSPDGSHILTTVGFPQKAAQLWKTEDGTLEREFLGHTDWLTDAAFSSDGTHIVTAAADRTVKLWNPNSGDLLRTFSSHLSAVQRAAISPNGLLVAGGGTSFSPVAHVWTTHAGNLTRSFEANAGSVTCLAFSPDNALLLVGWEDGLVRLFALETTELVHEFVIPAAFLHTAVFSPDGEHILTGESFPFFTARLWSVQTGDVRRIFLGHTWSIHAVAFSPDGHWILTGGDNVRLWDIRDLLAGLATARTPFGLELRWNLGSLEQTDDPPGPWTPVPDATSPRTVPLDEPRRFFRVTIPPDTQAPSSQEGWQGHPPRFVPKPQSGL